MKKNILSAFRASAFASLIATLIISYAMAQTATYNVTPNELAQLKYYDAIKLIESRTHITTGFNALLYTATSAQFIGTFVAIWTALTTLCMTAFLVFFRSTRSREISAKDGTGPAA